MWNAITDVAGVMVGHAGNRKACRGCTVVLTPAGAMAGVDVRGAAPGTRETDLLRPGQLVEKVHGILLTGGSAFGLDAAGGVMQYLEEQGYGFDTGYAKVPIVPGAVIFDLHLGDPAIRPDRNMGYQACRAAVAGPVPQGNAGAGLGATVGKLLGPARAMKGGVGTASAQLANGVTVGALAVVNAFGAVRDPDTGKYLAGPRDPLTGEIVDAGQLLQSGALTAGLSNTTIAVVATDAALTKEQVNRVACMAHNGLARVIFPIHTMYDGDTVFALSTGIKPGDVSVIGAVAAEVLARAVINAVLFAAGTGGIPAHRDLQS